MKTIKILDLAEELKEHFGLGLFNSIFDLLHFEKHKAHEAFARLIKVSLQDYAHYYPVQLMKYNCDINRVYKFHSNFDSYLKGQENIKLYKEKKEEYSKLDSLTKDQKEELKKLKDNAKRALPEAAIQLLPRGIYWIRNYLGTNAQWWRFVPERYELFIRLWWSRAHVSYFADYPYVIKYSPDGLISEDSKIYYLDLNEDQFYIIFIAFHLLKYVRNMNTSVNLNLPIQFLGNLDTLISETQEQYNDIIESRVAIYESWRK